VPHDRQFILIAEIAGKIADAITQIAKGERDRPGSFHGHRDLIVERDRRGRQTNNGSRRYDRNFVNLFRHRVSPSRERRQEQRTNQQY
jgi:hypothetical protein